MKIAIMQPYFFPYIGYFQMVAASDVFVFYDDVNYIERGWINRNCFIERNGKKYFTVPVEKASSYKKINQIKIAKSEWKNNFQKMIQMSYGKAPFFNETKQLVKEILTINYEYIHDLAKASIIQIAKKLNMETNFVYSSSVYENEEMVGTERLLNICAQNNASGIIMPVGSAELYGKNDFLPHNILLRRVQMPDVTYKQYSVQRFEPNLSILDVLMFNGIDKTRAKILNYKLD